ncbi:GNAT family N-acetyltransferase [Kitasatospora sp. NPDC057595]|uniref:GNAT family N-acetyltransferase n=2 Tax=unclassified Kitasatospora TaxID=2633591 RepID=UPI0036C1A40D
MIELRELVPGDAEALLRIYSAEATRYLGRAPMDAAEARYYAQSAAAHAAQNPRTLYMLGLTVDGDLVGIVKLHCDRPAATISYILRPDAWGRGYATEGVHKILALAFGRLGLPEVHAKHHPDNPASGRVLLKAGFVPAGEHTGCPTYVVRPSRTVGGSRLELAPPTHRDTPMSAPSPVTRTSSTAPSTASRRSPTADPPARVLPASARAGAESSPRPPGRSRTRAPSPVRGIATGLPGRAGWPGNPWPGRAPTGCAPSEGRTVMRRRIAVAGMLAAAGALALAVPAQAATGVLVVNGVAQQNPASGCYPTLSPVIIENLTNATVDVYSAPNCRGVVTREVAAGMSAATVGFSYLVN